MISGRGLPGRVLDRRQLPGHGHVGVQDDVPAHDEEQRRRDVPSGERGELPAQQRPGDEEHDGGDHTEQRHSPDAAGRASPSAGRRGGRRAPRRWTHSRRRPAAVGGCPSAGDRRRASASYSSRRRRRRRTTAADRRRARPCPRGATARRRPSPSASSTASMVPSSARPVTTRSVPRRSIAWWWTQWPTGCSWPIASAARQPEHQRHRVVHEAVVLDVLHERAAEGDVEHLVAAADRQHRAPERRWRHGRTPGRTRRARRRRHRRARRPRWRRSGAGRRPGPPGRHSPSKRASTSGEVVDRRRQRRQDDGLAAGADDGVEVRASDGDRRHPPGLRLLGLARGDGDQRPHRPKGIEPSPGRRAVVQPGRDDDRSIGGNDMTDVRQEQGETTVPRRR